MKNLIRHRPIEPATAAESESSVRQRAKRKGYKLTKIREGSRDYYQYGPFMICDASTNGVLNYGLTLIEADEWLTAA